MGADAVCRLCGAPLAHFAHSRQHAYHRCSRCLAVQMAAVDLPDADRERALYLTHNNDVDDPRYRQFVSPITQAVLAEQRPGQAGLDFGAGTGPVITTVLREQGHDIVVFDPFFHPDRRVLQRQYDYIVCCEVIEHFHRPAREFALLRSLLKPGGRLYCMTRLFDESIDFQRWYYKNDPTHVFFYHRASLDWIRERFDFSRVTIAQRLQVFYA